MPGVLGTPQVIQCDWSAGFLRRNTGEQCHGRAPVPWEGADAMVRSLDSLCYRHRVKEVFRQMVTWSERSR